MCAIKSTYTVLPICVCGCVSSCLCVYVFVCVYVCAYVKIKVRMIKEIIYNLVKKVNYSTTILLKVNLKAGFRTWISLVGRL